MQIQMALVQAHHGENAGCVYFMAVGNAARLTRLTLEQIQQLGLEEALGVIEGFNQQQFLDYYANVQQPAWTVHTIGEPRKPLMTKHTKDSGFLKSVLNFAKNLTGRFRKGENRDEENAERAVS